ncbi:PPM-type phosphatase-like domain [Dillenia turbinata]|uniref:protein-serine/threonine phosphatase n=1 Tax=Dillenia turbinata TaxID=194707 RepID=A0AAN8VMU5_9MAGN
MEDDVIVVRSDDLDGFLFAAVFDGHVGFSSVEFLRLELRAYSKSELYKGCVTALQGGLLLKGNDFNAVRKALEDAFEKADTRLIHWLETTGDETDLVQQLQLYSLEVVCCTSRTLVTHAWYILCRVIAILDCSLHVLASESPSLVFLVFLQVLSHSGKAKDPSDNLDLLLHRMLQKGVEEGSGPRNLYPGKVQVRADLVFASPDIYQMALGSDAEFLILASDGLWDYINSSEAVTFVRNQLRQHGDVHVDV